MKYKYLKDLTSDVLFEARGKTLNELFENSALALFEVMCKMEKVQPKSQVKFELKKDSIEDLLFDWLQNLIAAVDIEQMFFSKFKIIEIKNNKLTAVAYGEPITPEKGNTVVKSVTNYKFGIKKVKNNYMATVSLDI